MIARVLGRLTELINNRLRWRIVWIAHTKIDDILTGPPRLHFELIDDGIDGEVDRTQCAFSCCALNRRRCERIRPA